MQRSLTILVGALVIVAGTAATASAVFTENTLGCSGSATITTPEGTTHQIDASDGTVELPRAGDAAWVGATTQLSKNHSGFVSIQIGPVSRAIDDWGPSENARNEKSADGDHTYDVPDWIPPFKIRVSGVHVAIGDAEAGAPAGRCAGYVDVELGGSVTDSPLGMGVVGATIVMGLLTISAGKARKRP